MKKRLTPKKQVNTFSIDVKQNIADKSEVQTVHVDNVSLSVEVAVLLKDQGGKEDFIIEVCPAHPEQLREYNRSTKQAATAGFQVKLNGVPAYSFFILPDGSIKQDNLFDIMITAVGNARQSEGMVRAMIDKAQRYACDVKRNIATYNHFYGELTEEQKAWMLENTVSYEHEMEVAKQRAKLRNGGTTND